MGKIANRQSLAFSERSQLSQAIPQFHRERMLNEWTPTARFWIAAQRTQGLWGPSSVLRGEIWPQRTLAIRIAAITLASDPAITIARFRPSKASTETLVQSKIPQWLFLTTLMFLSLLFGNSLLFPFQGIPCFFLCFPLLFQGFSGVATLSFFSSVFLFPWCFSCCKNSLVFLSVFCLVLRAFKGSHGEKNPWCFWGFPWYFRKEQGKEGQGRDEKSLFFLGGFSLPFSKRTRQGRAGQCLRAIIRKFLFFFCVAIPFQASPWDPAPHPWKLRFFPIFKSPPRQTKPKKGAKRKVHEFRPFLWILVFFLGKTTTIHIELLFRNAPAESSWTGLSLVWFAGVTLDI